MGRVLGVEVGQVRQVSYNFPHEYYENRSQR
jgi:hypothetical protein